MLKRMHLVRSTALASPTLFAAPAMAATQPSVVSVRPSGSNSTRTGSTTAPYATISQAVSAVAPDGVVAVESGTDLESVSIANPVRIVADGALSDSASNTILDASGQSNGIVRFGAGASGSPVPRDERSYVSC